MVKKLAQRRGLARPASLLAINSIECLVNENSAGTDDVVEIREGHFHIRVKRRHHDDRNQGEENS